jgi:hypothetical protein
MNKYVLKDLILAAQKSGDPEIYVADKVRREVYLASDVDALIGQGLVIEPAHIAQLRDLLRCVAWIRDLQINSDPEIFDNRELFADFVKPYGIDQLHTARKLFARLDDYCKLYSIPAHEWKMK